MLQDNKKYRLLLGLLYPLGGLIYSIRNIGNQGSRFLFVLFCVYFGMIFIYFPEGTNWGEGADSMRYAMNLKDAYAMEDVGFMDYVTSYKGGVDFYAPAILYVISRFTDNVHFFYAVVALIYGIFYSKFVWLVAKHSSYSKNKYYLLFFFMLLLIAPIWKINGVRWWTGLYMFCYALGTFLLEGRKGTLLWALCSVFVHFTFLYPMIIFVLYLLFPKRKLWPYVSVFVLINLMGTIDLSIFQDWVRQILPVDNADQVAGYMTFEYKAERNWFADSAKNVGIYLNLYLVILFYLKARLEILKDKTLLQLFVLALMFETLCLFINMAPWGGRFLNLGDLMLYVFFCVSLSNKVIYSNVIKYVKPVTPFLLYIVLFQIKDGFYAVGFFSLFLGNFFTAFALEDNMPIINFINNL